MARAEDLSIDAYRRQQRKKELKKNKTARIKARDEKVAATRSVEDVKAEISQLERKRDRNNEKSGLDAQEIKKLERLQKELRIVEAESVKRKALAEQAQIERDKELLAAQKTVEGVQKLNESKYSLVERYASVYYDEQMNPFGAPAPGQPKLYYADSEGKTTTMDSRRAVVPEKWREKFNLEGGRGRGDGPELHEDKSRVARERRWDDSGDTNCMNPPIDIAPSQQYVSAPSQFTPHPPHLPPPPVPYQVHNGAPSPPPPPRQMPPPPPPPPPLNAPPPPPPPPSRLPIDKTQPPPLPQPSKAVLRAAKRSAGKTNALADIWASQEEMEYEQTVKGTSLDIEGTADQQPQPYLPRWKRNKISAKSKGHLADVNDPCCPSADGYGEYRNRDQIERQSRDVARLQKQQHEHAANLVAAAASTSSSSQQQLAQTVPATFFYNVQQPIWYYQDNTSGAIQGPFSGEQMMGWRSFFLPTTPVRFGHDSVGKFTPLSEIDFINLPHQLVPPPPPPPEEKLPAEVQDDANVDNGVDNGDEFEVESEVAQVAMPPLCAEDDATELPNLDKDLDPEVDICIPPPSDEDDSRDEYEKDNNSVEKNTYPEVDTCIPPPSDDEADEEDELDDDGGDDQEVDMCVPPPSDDDEGNEFDVPYPSVEYPYPNDEEVPYPVDVEYPVDDVYGYPADGKEIGDAAGETSAVAPYPSDVVFGVTCDGEGRAEDQILVPAVAADRKKKYDGDKAVVGFVPSHLRVKRKVAKPSKPKSKSLEPETNYSQDETQGRSSVAGDYIKFMEEITQLK